MRWRSSVILLILVGLLVGPTGCGPREKTELKVLFAGSLIVPFDELEAAFEDAHPNVDVLMEGHGSIQVIRHVTEIHDLVDVAVTADHALIPMLMYPAQVPETGEPYADWYVEFATNRLTLAYTEQSAHADEIDASNWYRIIAKSDVRMGLSDPRFDAAGYRGLMALQLAELHYDDPIIFENVFMGRFQSALQAQEEGDRWVVRVPEVVQPKPDSGIVMRGGSIQLIALLESGDVDYAFEYESVSRQHGFHYVALPAALHMGDEAAEDFYAQVEVKLDFQRFASVEPTFAGEFIGYGVTIPANAPHPDLAAEFVAFLLGPEGERILKEHHHPLLQPPRADGYENVPDPVRELCVPME
jgi:molybdate/tungstate transport system substrate-binding protein